MVRPQSLALKLHVLFANSILLLNHLKNVIMMHSGIQQIIFEEFMPFPSPMMRVGKRNSKRFFMEKTLTEEKI